LIKKPSRRHSKTYAGASCAARDGVLEKSGLWVGVIWTGEFETHALLANI